MTTCRYRDVCINRWCISLPRYTYMIFSVDFTESHMIKVYLNNYLCDHSSIYHNQYLYNIVYISLYIYNLYFWYTIVLYITFYVGQLVQKKKQHVSFRRCLAVIRLVSSSRRCSASDVWGLSGKDIWGSSAIYNIQYNIYSIEYIIYNNKYIYICDYVCITWLDRVECWKKTWDVMEKNWLSWRKMSILDLEAWTSEMIIFECFRGDHENPQTGHPALKQPMS